jgi:GvpH.
MTDDGSPDGPFDRLQSFLETLAALEKRGERTEHGRGRLGDGANRIDYEYTVSTGLVGDRRSVDGDTTDDDDRTTSLPDEPHLETRVDGEELHVVGLLPRAADCEVRLDEENGVVTFHDGTETIERIELGDRDTPITEAGTVADDTAIVGVSHNDQFLRVRLARTDRPDGDDR